ncbi:hypothetical protein ABIE49_006130 [Bradyrhizobium sp. OAE829]
MQKSRKLSVAAAGAFPTRQSRFETAGLSPLIELMSAGGFQDGAFAKPTNVVASPGGCSKPRTWPHPRCKPPGLPCSTSRPVRRASVGSRFPARRAMDHVLVPLPPRRGHCRAACLSVVAGRARQRAGEARLARCRSPSFLFYVLCSGAPACIGLGPRRPSECRFRSGLLSLGKGAPVCSVKVNPLIFKRASRHSIDASERLRLFAITASDFLARRGCPERLFLLESLWKREAPSIMHYRCVFRAVTA